MLQNIGGACTGAIILMAIVAIATGQGGWEGWLTLICLLAAVVFFGERVRRSRR